MENPFKKFPIQSGLLSFLLPGLGQLFQHRLGMALLFFLTSTCVLSLAPIRLWIFVPMAVSAWEAQRMIQPSRPQWNPRVFIFFFVGVVAFFATFSLLAERVLSYPNQGKISAVADHLAEQIGQCALQSHVMPLSLVDVLEHCPQVKWQNDPWGNSYRYQTTVGGYEIRSLGRDGQPDTTDDFIYRFMLPLPFRATSAGSEKSLSKKGSKKL